MTNFKEILENCQRNFEKTSKNGRFEGIRGDGFDSLRK